MNETRAERVLGFRAALRFMLAEAEELGLATVAAQLREAIAAIDQHTRPLVQ